MAAAMALTLLPVTALAAGSDSETDDYAFDAGTGTLTVKTYSGMTGLESWKSDGSFSATDVIAVEIRPDVDSIGMGAFSGCSALTSVTIPASVTSIEAWAFSSCTSLSAVDLSGVAEIGDYAFYDCTNLTSVTFPAGAYTIYDNAFNSAGLSGSIDLSGVTEIGAFAFANCADLTSVTFPAGAYIIGDYAFCNTGLSGSIDLGGVTAIGDAVFAACADLNSILLTGTTAPTFGEEWADGVPRVYYPAAWGVPVSVTNLNYSGNAFPDSVTTDDYHFSALTGTLTVKTNAGTAYSSDDYEDTNWRHSSSGIDPAAVTSVIIQDGVTEIGEYAFSNYPGLTDLTSVTFPASGYTIGLYAFSDTGLTGSIDLGGVTAIGHRAFMDCAGLTSVTFPASAYTIGMMAFCDSGLTGSIDLGGVTEIDEGALSVPANLTVILSGTTVPTFHGAWAYGVQRVYYPAAWGAPDSVTNLNYNSNAFAIIDIAAITSLTAPVRGAAPVSAITETAQYTGTVTWSPSDSIFAANTVYTATVTLTPKTYYTLACVPENFFTVAGAASVTNAANAGVITAAFPSTSAAPITIGGIPGVTAPVRGAAAVGAITETAQYTGTVTWSPADNPFKASTVYTATITLTPKTGYTLTGVAANFFTVAGATSVTNAAGSGVITAAFPSTSDAPITIGEIPGVTAPVRGVAAVGTITETAQYTGTVTWSPADNPFKASTVYTATITLTPKTGYTLTGVAANFFTVAGATSAANSANTGVITAIFPATGAASAGSDTSGGSAGEATTPPSQGQSIRLPGGGTAPVSVNTSTGNAGVNLSSLSGSLTADKNTTVTVPPITGVTSYTATLPTASLSGSGRGSLTVNTDLGSLTIPGNMLSGAGLAGDAGVTIGTASKETREGLPDDVKNAIGERPLIQLTLTVNGIQTDWSNPNAPVTVRIPYAPTAAELAEPESIVVWYIDGGGNIVAIPNGRYDPATGLVTFHTTHFSDYAVAYRKVSFQDVADGAWYHKAVSFIAAREITGGTGGGNYSPEAALTRGEFIVLLMRAYGIAPDKNPTDNFSDAGNTYYTGYLATAKRLGITTGVGNSRYAPGNRITRQEMFTLLYNALKVIGQLPEGSSGKKVSDFSDASGIALWAREAMTALVASGTVGGSNGTLTPTSTTTRAEMAQVLYNLLGK
jgi:hypothetical protein